ncbi:GH92 family glycosyl hydrolase [Arachidicoccus terrestris]|nr:GH92 family glycosyl hydrolase [Arachidicoccus terrestris]
MASPAAYVNPMIGASTSVGEAGIYHGLGKTFPGATTPYGMVQVSPNTITGGDNGSGYSDEHTSIEGFAFTQMSGIGWYGDLGNFLVMPATGPLRTFAGTLENPSEGYRSLYDKASEKASAGYYSVFLEKYKVKAEMTAAPHSGIMRFTFPAGSHSRIQIDLARRVGGTASEAFVRVVDDHTIEGWMKCTPEGGGWGDGVGKADYTVYFYTKFSKPLRDYGVWTATIPDTASRKREAVTSAAYQRRVAAARVLAGQRSFTEKHIGFYTEFATGNQENVFMKTGISFVSQEGARENLMAEIKDWNFDRVHHQAVDRWNKALGKIMIQGGSREEKTVFYTALYHTMIDPRNITDVNGDYPGGDGRPHQAKGFTKRTIFSGWDVFRSQMPLQTIINPALVSDMINSLISLAEQTDSSYFPRWELFNAYTGCMIGNPAVSMIADAYSKGIRSYDLQKAYQYSLGTVRKFDNGPQGYTPGGLSISETLEYAYADWCLSVLAADLGKSADARLYANKAMDYKHIFDKEKHWFRPKNKDGSWQRWPENGRLTQNYGTIESNPYQQGWFVPQDVDGMVAMMGGPEKVKNDLTYMFEHTPENFMWNDYYNHANEPVHHVPFLFNRVGAPWLTQQWTRRICAGAYHNKVEGLVGNEDVGQMSAWYVLAAAGIHPVCPGDPRYEITSPVFSKIRFKLMAPYASGKNFTIIAKNNSEKNIYIQSAKLNGKPYNKCYLMHSDMAAGGTLELVMGDRPNKSWGAEP